jgi:predicted polyphosphate/ATP-dependent NAD kinase
MIGLIINPVAGLGGPVGLKGTDGLAEKAIQLGAVPTSQKRAVRMLTRLKPGVCTCGGNMGAEAAEEAQINYQVVYEPSYPTSYRDTVRAAKTIAHHVDLLVFCGGDGTARDISSAVSVPVLGVPAGVKMYSACFALTPESAADTINSFVDKSMKTTQCEILDINEELYRQGVLSVNLFGYAHVPSHTQVQVSKHVITDDTYQKREIAAFISELMDDDTFYIMGAGTTTKAIGDFLSADKTLLGVDIFKGKTLIKKDCSEKDILETITAKKVKIVVSPIGGQGFIFGRGNQQISPEVINQVGVKNIVVVAAPEKLISTPALHVDTGDTILDSSLQGEYHVVCGYNLTVRREVGS